jgi:putative oxidoreductase
MKLGAPLLRAVIGPLFVGHGTQKLFGWFEGPGLEGASGMMEKLDRRPGRRHALAAAVSETAGGALLTLGALTPVATALLTGSMVTAIRKVHAPKGVWNTQGGYEYNAVLIAALTSLASSGPGKPSVDAARLPWMHGAAWALGSLAAGVAGSYLTERPPFNEPEPDAEPSGRFTREQEREPTTA